MKIFLAGGESWNHMGILEHCQAPYILLSYYKFRKQKVMDEWVNIIQRLKAKGVEFMLDSGAHTFYSETGVGKSNVAVRKTTKTTESYDEYVDKYIGFLLKWGNLFNYYVELDIHGIVNMDKIYQFRELFWKAGLKPMLVGHPEQPMVAAGFPQEWRKLCQKDNYLALGGNLPEGQCMAYIQQAHSAGAEVHGFAMTKVDVMNRIPFDSVDSTTWLSGGRFGLTCYFQAPRILMTDDKKQRFRFKDKIINQYKLNWDLIASDSSTEVDKMNCYAWLEYQAYLLHSKGRAIPLLILNNSKIKKQDTVSYSQLGKQASEEASIDRAERLLKERKIVEVNANEHTKEGGATTPLPHNSNSSKDIDTKTKDSFDPTSIQNITKANPLIEQKRKDAHKQAMTGNVYGWVTGSKSKRLQPVLCNEDCFAASKCSSKEFGNLCAVRKDIRELSAIIHTRNPDTVINYLNGLNQVDIQRHLLGYHYEQAMGGIIDKQVTNLGITITDRFKILFELVNSPRFTGDTQIKDSVINVYNLSGSDAAEISKVLIAKEQKDGKPVTILEAEVVK